MVLSSLNTGNTFLHNELRANNHYSPASTFKVVNSLIALEEGVVTGEGIEFYWDGQVHGIENWNADQSLETAFGVSCVWCFQELARRLGAEIYAEYLSQLNYGSLEENFDLTTFWLDGSLRVSATEQIELLKQVYLRNPVFSESSYDKLEEIMLVDQTAEYSLWAKSGWAARNRPYLGWYIGYVKTAEDVWFFATNINAEQKDLPLRALLTREALMAKGIIPQISLNPFASESWQHLNLQKRKTYEISPDQSCLHSLFRRCDSAGFTCTQLG